MTEPDIPKEDHKPKGMAAFSVIWVGQLVSVLGSAMTQFALMIWVWEETGQATAMALMGFFTFLPMVIMMPFAGALVDRWNKKLAMMLGDLAAGLGSVAILLLYLGGSLEIWHLYLIGIFIGVFGAFQWPAYSSAITVMVDKKHYARASGLVGMVGSISGIFGPPLAAFFLVMLDISGILIIDIVTFTFAIGVLLLVHIPNPPPADDLQTGAKGLLKDAAYGFKYIYKRKPLLGLQSTFFVFNLIITFGMVVMVPMILARTGSDKLILASVQSVLAIGGVAGGLLIAIWGGPRRKINGLLGGMIVIAVIFAIGFGMGQTPIIWMIFGFMAMLLIPTLNGSSQAIWQSKVPANRQGRVFAARMVIAQGAGAAAMVIVGPLADFYFEPAMAVHGSLAPTFGWLVGTGPGAGMGLMILLSSLLAAMVGAVAYQIRIIRNVERIIPDADPKSWLDDYRQRLTRAYRKGKLTEDQCKEMYLEKKAKLGLNVPK
ncbi:MAG: MFS transporter [Candidatus Thermoplasmatota archaeon]|nr:MFS transporter [Euryarchaeota archaeon]MBU4031874.1 MFS transporter [Candidatus Thermoplasmatota archaeon]MBU4071440.1 MFS transporter [Candidatus Thermoplasmatota archaeon]MBU4143826.1 MFS transporter [Candidatus Thermoplasmatota archaeon]MBU4591611.1 MFS transporter [Candidatus Thermoplasmatota archaeon]